MRRRVIALRTQKLSLVSAVLSANAKLLGATAVLPQRISRDDYSFFAPLTHSLIPLRGGTPTFTRATVAYVQDHEGILRAVKSGEARFTGARRVENLFQRTQEFENAYWTLTNATVVANASVAPDGTTTADEIRATAVNNNH